MVISLRIYPRNDLGRRVGEIDDDASRERTDPARPERRLDARGRGRAARCVGAPKESLWRKVQSGLGSQEDMTALDTAVTEFNSVLAGQAIAVVFTIFLHI